MEDTTVFFKRNFFFNIIFSLAHIGLASILWDLGKQFSPRCDATEHGVPSGAVLFVLRNCIENGM